MPVTRTLPPLPEASIPVVDDSGRMTDAWRRYFVALMAVLAEMRDEIP